MTEPNRHFEPRDCVSIFLDIAELPRASRFPLDELIRARGQPLHLFLFLLFLPLPSGGVLICASRVLGTVGAGGVMHWTETSNRAFERVGWGFESVFFIFCTILGVESSRG
jgi:hypothetical protein